MSGTVFHSARGGDDDAVTVERNAALVDAFGEIVFEWRPPSDEVIWGGRFTEILGYTPEEMGSDTAAWRERVHPDDLDSVVREVEAMTVERRRYDLEHRFRRSDGSYKWMHARGVPFFDEAGVLVRVVGIFSDVTARRAAHSERVKTAAMLRMASRVTGVGAWWVELVPELRVHWSDEIKAIFGSPSDYQPDAADVLDRYAPEHRPILRDAFLACLKEGKSYDLQLQLLRPDGRRVWTRSVAEAVRDESGRIVCIQGAFQDISGLKAVEESLATSQERFRQLADSMPFIVWTARPDGQLDYANRELHEYAGVDPGAAWERWLACVHPEDSERFIEVWSRNVGEEKAFVIEHRLRRADGEYRWFRLHAAPTRDAAGQLATWFGVTVDIHDTKRLEREARTYAERLATTLDSITDAFLTVDRRWRMTFVSPAAERLARKPWSELLGRSLWDVFPELRFSAFGRAYERAMADNVPVAVEDLYSPRGLWIDARAYPSSEGLTLSLRDVTEQRAGREALRTSEERFRLLARATNDAIWDWDLTTDSLWWNDGLETLFGFGASDVDGTIASWETRIHPDERATVLENVRSALAGGADSWSSEYRFLRKDGSYAYVLDRGHAIRDASGTAVRMIGGMTDLTERRAAEERAAEQAELLEKAQDAILVRDLEGRVKYMNRRAELLYGWSREDALGNDVRAMQFSRDPDSLARATAATVGAGSWNGELTQVRRDGSTVVVEARWTLLRRADGAPTGILAINTDVTERKRLEQQLLRAQRIESIGTLAGGIAHDLNNILTPILTSISYLKDDETDPQRLEDLHVLDVCARRGAGMVRQLLLFARGEQSGVRSEVKLSAVAADVFKLARETFPKHITTVLLPVEDEWPVRADPTQMHQLLMNLSVNARDAMPDGGRLTIALESVVLDETYAAMNPQARPGPYVVLRVEDTGVGIPAEIQERIFEPFFTTKEVGQGTGLGLSTSHAIVHGHGGFMHLYSELKKGSRFKIYLPAALPEAVSEKVQLAQSRLPRGNGELILVVDDEEGVRRVTSRMLERYGYRVLTAANGAEAVSLYAKHERAVALVLTDMSMPVMDGPATIVALRAMDPRVRIVGSSGLDTDGRMAQAVGAGVHDFVPKPYTAEALLTTVRRVIDERPHD